MAVIFPRTSKLSVLSPKTLMNNWSMLSSRQGFQEKNPCTQAKLFNCYWSKSAYVIFLHRLTNHKQAPHHYTIMRQSCEAHAIRYRQQLLCLWLSKKTIRVPTPRPQASFCLWLSKKTISVPTPRPQANFPRKQILKTCSDWSMPALRHLNLTPTNLPHYEPNHCYRPNSSLITIYF